MREQLRRGLSMGGLMAAAFLLPVAAAQEIPRTADGRPDFNGIWQALSNAHWSIEPQAADHGPDYEWGAIGAVRPSVGVVQDGPLPYTEEGRERQQANREDWLALDPLVKCYMPGVPRANYLPFPFQIVQSGEQIVMAYEFASAMRIIYMDRPDFEAPVDAWMGHSRGHWEDDTLVVRVTDQVANTWFDHAGNHHSSELEVIERYTLQGPDHLLYEAEIHDPEVYTRPWTLELPLYRRVEDNAQLLEFKCAEFAEELLYGHLSKDADEDREPPRGTPFSPQTD